MGPRVRTTGKTGDDEAGGVINSADRQLSKWEKKYPILMSSAVALMAMAYAVSSGLYGAGVGLEGVGVTYNSTILPYYNLYSNKASYEAAGLARPLGTDNLYVSRAVHAPATTPVYVETRTFGLLTAVAIFYFVPFVLVWWKSDMKKKGELESNLSKLSKTLLSVAMLLVWMFVQTDLMFILGNNDKAASWMATGIILAQVALYHAADNDDAVALIDENKDLSIIEGLLEVKHGIVFLALFVAVYLWCMSVGVGIIMPLDYAGGTVALAEQYRSVVGFYITTQVVELFRFAVIVLGNSAASKQGTIAALGKFARNDAVAIFGHCWVFTLATIYAFHPGSLIYQAGQL
jgi:hypothetical protein